VYPIDPAAGTLGTPIVLTDANIVHAAQGDELWVHDGDRDAERRSKADVKSKTVETDNELGFDFEIRSLAFNPVNSTLWLHGYDYEDRVNRILVVNTSGASDILLSSPVIGLSVAAMTWDGSYLWALADENPASIYQIHPRTFKVLATYKLDSDAGAYYHGIASVGSSLYLIGSADNEFSGVLTEVKPVQ
jgi:hypothetical protein